MTLPNASCPDDAGTKEGPALPPLRRILFLLGTGGVGKTTCSVVLAHALARTGRRVLLTTVDPARRLDDLMAGLEETHPNLEIIRTDVGKLFRDYVRRHAPDEETARHILESRFFPHLTQRLQSLHEYVSGDLIRERAAGESFDHIVVDTPPFAYAMHFLEAPQRLSQMAKVAGSLFGAGRRAAAPIRALSPVLSRGLSYFLGKGFLQELVDFVASFGRLWDEIERTSGETQRLYREEASFALVCQPDTRSTDDLLRFLDERPDWLEVDLLLVNRILRLPVGFTTRAIPDVEALFADLQSEGACRRWRTEVLRTAAATTHRLAGLAGTVRAGQDSALAQVAQRHPRLASDRAVHLPLIPGGITDRDSLDCLADHIRIA